MSGISLKSVMIGHPDCITNGKKLKSLLLDLFPNASKGEINIISIIADCGIASEILKSDSVDRLQKDRWLQKLSNDYCLNEQIADECIAMWCEAIAFLKAYDEAIIYIKQAEESEPNIAVKKYICALECFENKIENGTVIFKHRIDKILRKMCRICLKASGLSPHNYFFGIEKCQSYGFDQIPTLLGHCLKYGIGTEVNVKKAIGKYCISRMKDPNALVELGDCWQNGIGCDRSNDNAIHEYKSAVSLGSKEAEKLIKDIVDTRLCPYPHEYVLKDGERNEDDFVFVGDTLNKYVGNKANIEIPAYITKINTLAFAGCNCIESITIGQNVSIIENGAFAGCNNLKEVKILSNKIHLIQRKTFFGCIKLEKLELPTSIVCLDAQAFGWCISLKSINLPNSVERIENKCFIGCRSLEKVVLPFKLKELGFGAFFLCRNLNTVEYTGVKDTWNMIKGVRRITEVKSNDYLFTFPELISSNETCKLIIKNDLSSEAKDRIDLLNTLIEDLNFTTRTESVLRRAGLKTLFDVVSRSESDLANIRNLGIKGQNEVLEKVASLQLGMNDE